MPRKAKISREAVLAAALQVVDQEGLAALSMRRLGKALGVEAMSLYRHVSNKEAVLDGVYEAVLRDIQMPPLTDTWRDDLKALVHAFRDALYRHPNTVPLFVNRPAVTENSLAYVEQGMTILQELFPQPEHRCYAFQILVTFLIGHTLFQLGAEQDAAEVPAYGDLPEASFPTLRQMGRNMNTLDLEEEFQFGLDALLIGLEALGRR